MAALWRLRSGYSHGKMAIIPASCVQWRRYSTEGKSKGVRIGCASGFWGDTPTAAPQLIHHGRLDFLMFDYLSEITMSLLTAAKSKRPELGYAPDFVMHALGPHLAHMKRQGIRVLSNAGGINPEGCAAAVRMAAKKAGVDIKVGVVTGDDLVPQKKDLVNGKLCDMNSGLPLPPTAHSINAYLGAAGMVHALDRGADVVVTGRCADSALALAPLMHTYGWGAGDYDLLAAGSLAGHLIECGAQVTGGIYTDWHEVKDWHNIGFPIAEVFADGHTVITKPPGTGGLISSGTVAEQLLYEIGDPRAYVLPDVVCDFSGVAVQPVEDGVAVTGIKGSPPTDCYKVSSTYMDGYKATAVCVVGGPESARKGRWTAEAIVQRCQSIYRAMGIKDFSRVHIQVIGAEESYGPLASQGSGPREGVIWLSVAHPDKLALELFSREIAAAGTGMAPGLTAIVGGRPKPSPLLRLHSALIHKDTCKVKAIVEGEEEIVPDQTLPLSVPASTYDLPDQPTSSNASSSSHVLSGTNSYRLEELAHTRSGDKGDTCNVGVVARHPALYPYLLAALTSSAVMKHFSHVFGEEEPHGCVKRYEVPGVCGLNFVLERSLGGGGVASLRPDPQGKAFGQMLLDFQITSMPDITALLDTSVQ